MSETIIDERLAYSEAFIFVMENFVRILKMGHCEQTLCFNNKSLVAYIKQDDQVVGACVFECDYDKGQGYIYTAGVHPEYRGRGIYTQIYKSVEDYCRTNGMKVLNSNVHVDNTTMLDHAIRNDRDLSWFRTSKVL